MVYSWCWLGIWVLAGSWRSGCNELLEVVWLGCVGCGSVGC